MNWVGSCHHEAHLHEGASRGGLRGLAEGWDFQPAPVPVRRQWLGKLCDLKNCGEDGGFAIYLPLFKGWVSRPPPPARCLRGLSCEGIFLTLVTGRPPSAPDDKCPVPLVGAARNSNATASTVASDADSQIT